MKSPLDEAIAIANRASPLRREDDDRDGSDSGSQTRNQASRDVYSVSRLNREARAALDGSFPLIWIEGELSNLSQPRSGHWYFSLKDEIAQVRCAMFRNRNRLLRFVPDSGARVIARAQVSLYEGRGEFQLVIEHMEPAGDGALRRAFEDLKQRLDNEGLFASQHKQPLPLLPHRIAVITSGSGAALHDILTTIERRMPLIPVTVYPSTVQGEAAAPQLIKHLQAANRDAEHPTQEIIILARGGGSLEDLWAFNNEALARIIHDSDCPVVTGVGHEVDFTIADFVADLRAPTPTAAAELACPSGETLRQTIDNSLRRIEVGTMQGLEQTRAQLRQQQQRLHNQNPLRQLLEQQQRLDRAQMTLQRPVLNLLQQHKQRLLHLRKRLRGMDVIERGRQQRQRLAYLQERLLTAQTQLIASRRTIIGSRLDESALHKAAQTRLDRHNSQLALLATRLNSVSPLATLSRGYAILSDLQNRVIDSIECIQPGDTIGARVEDGSLSCRVTAVNPGLSIPTSKSRSSTHE